MTTIVRNITALSACALAWRAAASNLAVVIHHFNNLPPITTQQANAITAYLGAIGGLPDVASQAGMQLSDLLDHLADPNVQAHLAHADRIAARRARTRISDAAHVAVHVLEGIAEDVDLDKSERRRAATTLLRALSPPRGRRRDRLMSIIRATTPNETNNQHHPAPTSNPRPNAPSLSASASARGGCGRTPPPTSANPQEEAKCGRTPPPTSANPQEEAKCGSTPPPASANPPESAEQEQSIRADKPTTPDERARRLNPHGALISSRQQPHQGKQDVQQASRAPPLQ